MNIERAAFSVVIAVLLVSLMLTSTLSPLVADQANDQTEELFYVQSAKGGSLKEQGQTRTFSLELTGVNPEVVYFADRPYRDEGTISNERLVRDVFEDQIPPNATLTFEDAQGDRQRLVLELLEPTFTDSSMTYTARYLGEAEPTAQSFEDAELFIDGHRAYNERCQVNLNAGQLMYLDRTLTTPDSTGDHWSQLPGGLERDVDDHIIMAWHSNTSIFSDGGGYHADVFYATAAGDVTAHIHIHCDVNGVQVKNTSCTYTVGGQTSDCRAESGYIDEDKIESFLIWP